MNFFNKFSFKTKLLGLCIFMASVSITIGAFAFVGINNTGYIFERVTGNVMPKLEQANQMFVEYRKIRINLRTLGLPGLSSADADLAVRNTLEAIEAHEKAAELYRSYGFVPGQKELYDSLQTSWSNFKAIGGRVLAHHKSGKPEDKKAMMNIFLHDCPDAAKVYTDDITKLLGFHKDVAQKTIDEAHQFQARTEQVILLVGVIGVVSGLLIGFIFSTAIAKKMSHVIENLSKSSIELTAASSQIASSSQELSQSATEQASSLQETATSLEQITAMISKASTNSEFAANSSSESRQKADEGRATVDQMIHSIEEISQSNEAIMAQINESNQQMAEIVKVIQEIGNKTKVINDIVFQTKLLSFNASVEAARAGEQGKGFAVVAEEVGNLAQMSGNAAKEISTMLEASIHKVEQIVQNTQTKVETLIEQGKMKIDSGSEVSKRCSQILNEIVDNVNKVSDLSQEISQASKEQSQGVSEINKALGQLDTVTQQNSSASEQTASAAEQLSAQAESLKSSIDDLVATIRGNSAESTATVRQKTNVIPFKSPKVKSAPAVEKAVKLASGSDFTPSQDDEGFQ